MVRKEDDLQVGHLRKVHLLQIGALEAEGILSVRGGRTSYCNIYALQRYIRECPIPCRKYFDDFKVEKT